MSRNNVEPSFNISNSNGSVLILHRTMDNRNHSNGRLTKIETSRRKAIFIILCRPGISRRSGCSCRVPRAAASPRGWAGTPVSRRGCNTKEQSVPGNFPEHPSCFSWMQGYHAFLNRSPGPCDHHGARIGRPLPQCAPPESLPGRPNPVPGRFGCNPGNAGIQSSAARLA